MYMYHSCAQSCSFTHDCCLGFCEFFLFLNYNQFAVCSDWNFFGMFYMYCHLVVFVCCELGIIFRKLLDVVDWYVNDCLTL